MDAVLQAAALKHHMCRLGRTDSMGEEAESGAFSPDISRDPEPHRRATECRAKRAS